MPGIAGLKAGLDFINRLGIKKIREHEQKLLKLAVNTIKSNKRIRLYASQDEAAQCGVLSFDIEGLSSEEAASKLSEKGFAMRAGMHCAPEAHKTAGTYEKGTVRMSFSVFNTSNEIIKLSHALVNLDS